MQNLRNKLLVGGAVLTLAAIGTVMNSHPALGQGVGGPTVTINAGQLPLPVTGTLGVMGTPNVKVTNTITAPVPVLDISHSASQHVALDCFGAGQMPICVAQGASSSSTPYAVPAGQNLVLTSVDISADSTSGGSGLLLVLPPSPGAVVGVAAGRWNVPSDGFIHSFQYPGGIVLPAGFVFGLSNSQGNVNLISATAILQGFLTAD
ncbi:MAG TPA: hypothetical protein VH639_24940 [Bryobacteraceae bacterium]|jgi:hypothetical protein